MTNIFLPIKSAFRCPCGRPAADFPSLLYYLFGGERAEKQMQAARLHKCVTCYDIDRFCACVVRRAAEQG